MLSKKNYNEKIIKNRPRKERFSIRKFSVGAASVLIGFFFMGTGQSKSVKADSVQDDMITQTDEDEALSDEVKIDVTDTSTEEVSNPATDTSTEEVNGPPSDSLTVVDPTMETQSPVEDTITTEPDNSAVNDTNHSTADTSEVETNTSTTDNVAAETTNAAESTTTNADDSVNATDTSTMTVVKTTEEKSDENDQTKEAVDKLTVGATKAKALAAAAEATEVKDVNDYQEFLDALRDSNVGTINLTGDVDFTDVRLSNREGLTDRYYEVLDEKNDVDIARAVTINGNGNKLIMSDRYIQFTSKNQKTDGKNWDIELKDLTLQTTSGYGPFWFDNTAKQAAGNTITFNGVNTTADSREIMWYKSGAIYSSTANVVFKGNNVINSTLKGDTAAIYAYSVKAEEGSTTTFNVIDELPANSGYDRAVIVIPDNKNSGNVTVAKGATLNINADNKVTVEGMDGSNSYGTMGIRFKGWAQNADIDTAATSVVQVLGNLNMNMGSGGSTAILGSYVDVQNVGNVNIETAQDGNNGNTGTLEVEHNGTHFGVITGGLAGSDNYAGIRIADGGTLKIVRSVDNENGNKSTQPLISYGDITTSNGKTFTIDVKPGGTLDLQDNAQNPNEWEPNTGTPLAGLITMWGTSGTNIVKINDTKYVNFQRTGTQPGSMLRLEGTTNSVSINGDGDAVTPVAQWDAGNTSNTPSYYWYILNEANQNNWGTNANGFTQKGETEPVNKVGEAKFLNSNGSIQMVPNQSGDETSGYNNGTISGSSNQTAYLNQFLNHFSWWLPQRIAMGSTLFDDKDGVADDIKPTDAQAYKPKVQDIEATTDQALEDVDPKDGVTGLTDSNSNTVENGLDLIDTITWLDPATDTDKWNELMPTMEIPTTVLTDKLTKETKAAWAKVTYKDGSVDFVEIPLLVTDNTTAYELTPTYAETTSEPGRLIDVDGPTFTDKDGKEVTNPPVTQYSATDDTPDWVTVDQISGVLSGMVPEGTTGDVVIPVKVTYEDGSSEVVNATIKMNTPTTNDHNPVYDKVEVTPGGTTSVTPTDKDKNDQPTTIPSGTRFEKDGDPNSPSWVTVDLDTGELTVAPPTDTKPGDYETKVKVTYPDGSTDEVPVAITVNEIASENEPTGIDMTVAIGSTPDPAEGIVNKEDLPKGTSYAWKDGQGPNTTMSGTYSPHTIVVTYPDGSTDEVTINVTVTGQADNYDPTAKEITVTQGEEPKPEDGIENINSLPVDASYSWKDGNVPSTNEPGETTATVVVTYSDGSTDEVEVPIKVTEPTTPGETDADKFTPQPQDVTVEQGKDPDPAAGVGNKGDLPQDTKYAWKNPVDTSTPGDPAADKYTPDYEEVEVKPGEPSKVTPTIKEGDNDIEIPKDTTFIKDSTSPDWVEVDPNTGKMTITPPVDTTPGDYEAKVKVMYPDGSEDEVVIKIKVAEPTTPGPTDADKHTPEAKDVTVVQGQTPDPAEGIGNKDTLPPGTRYAWKDPVDTTTPGDKTGTIVVTYPDGSTDEVSVTLHVTPSEGGTTDTSTTPPTDTSGSDTDTTSKGETPADTPPTDTASDSTDTTPKDENTDNKGGTHKSTNTDSSQSGATGNTSSGANASSNTEIHASDVTTDQYTTVNDNTADMNTLPQTGETDRNVGVWGMIIAAVGSLFGLGHGKKRRKDE